MLHTTDEIIAAAMALPDDDRAAVVDRLLETFDSSTRAEVDDVWAVEAERRLQAFRDGRIAAIPADEVFQSLGGADE